MSTDTRPRVLIVLGHPSAQSFNSALVDAAAGAAKDAGATVDVLRLGDLVFDPVLHAGFSEPQPLEPDLQKAQQALLDADHVVWVFPQWWGGLPALLKGFIDRVFLPGFAFRYVEGRSVPEKLLTGRSSRWVMTMDSPSWWYRLAYRNTVDRALGTATLRFSGFAPVDRSVVANVRALDDAQRQRALHKVAHDVRRDVQRLHKRLHKRRGKRLLPAPSVS